jgi:hypothetical protein
MTLQMKKYIFALIVAFSSFTMAKGEDGGYDVFVPISKYIEMGDSEKLSAWFSDNLEVTIFSNSNNSSRNQAKQIIKSFFKSYTPRTFKITHKAGRPNMKYALGTLTAGGEMFLVTIFVCFKDAEYKIQQFKIERID